MPTHELPVDRPTYQEEVAPWPGLGFTRKDVTPFSVFDDGVIPPDATITEVWVTATWLTFTVAQSVLQPFCLGDCCVGFGTQAYSNIISGGAPFYLGHHVSPPEAVNEAAFVLLDTVFGYNRVSSFKDGTNPVSGLPWASLDEVLGMDWALFNFWKTISGLPGFEEPTNPEDFIVSYRLDDISFKITYTGGTPPNTTQPTSSVPCCATCDCPPGGGGSTMPPSPVGNVPPPSTYTPVPQCAGGGELDVQEAITDSEMYF